MDKQEIIKVRNLVAGYGEEIILDRISFDIYGGEIFVILGESGCGKSTLLNHIFGLNHPISGSIVVDGNDISIPDDAVFKKVLSKIGVLFQGGALLGSMTLAENVALPIYEHTDLSKRCVDSIVKMKLGLVNLDGYEDHLPSEVSGGMKKRAGLARAMALNPKILFFDEPSAGLDPVTSVELDNLIIHLNKVLGTTMVIVTHELQSIYTVAHRVIMLDRNSKGIIAEGDPGYLRDHSKNLFVRKFFNRQADDNFNQAGPSWKD